MPTAKSSSKSICQHCGACCRLDGYVRVTAEEIAAIARHLETSVDGVRKRYIDKSSLEAGKTEVLLDHPGTTHCIFLEGKNHCIIHPVKPQQCRTFPTEWTRAGANLYCPALREAFRTKR